MKGVNMDQLIRDILRFMSTRDISLISEDGNKCEYDEFVIAYNVYSTKLG